jgi:hypothetical protein
LATADIPPLKAPIDLLPKTAETVLSLPANADRKGGSIAGQASGDLPEIALCNNRVEF